MLPAKIVVIGAGSASFGLNTLAAMMRSQRLRGCHLALVDRNEATLGLVTRLAQRLNEEWSSEMEISSHQHHQTALPEADFVVLCIEVPPREVLWRSDYEIPLKYGVRQPYAENSGPGGFAHAARNIGPVMEIVRDMEQVCPQAWLVNFTNPMMRICDAVHRYSSIKIVGLCHQILIGYAMIGKVLANELDIQVPEEFTSTRASPHLTRLKRFVARQTLQKVDLKAAGINHFSWMLSLHDRCTGEDLYPLFAKRWADSDPAFEPLTREIYSTFGSFPISGDEHLCEYLPWMSDPQTSPWEKFDLTVYEWDLWEKSRLDGHEIINRMASGEDSIEDLKYADSEGALEIVENIAGAGNHYHLAMNLPNDNFISNLPERAIVEVPGVVSASGVHGVNMGALPDPIAELCRREITVTRLCVDAAIHGDRQAALQCLLLDPVVTDIDAARNILDDYLSTYRTYLPQFWK
jgi:alpha-galactosidase